MPTHPYRHQQRRQYTPPQPRTLDQVWRSPYLEGGYFTEKGFLKLEYVRREKVEELAREMGHSLTSNQLRRFFHHCRAMEAKLRAKDTDFPWEKVEPDLHRLDAAASDALSKDPPKIPAIFHEFIQRNVAATRTRDDFLSGFLPHFEALVGFGAIHIKNKANSR